MPGMVSGVKKGKKKMKKLMVILAVVGLASATQAASFMWKLSTGSTYASMTVYGLTGTTSDAVLAAFGSNTATDWTAVVEGFDAVTAGTGARGGANGSNTGVSDGDKLVFAIIDGSIADGSKYYVTTEYTIPEGATFEPPATGTRQSIAVSLAGSGTFTATSPVPEPTSGLLMLLGMAGLALRRRRA